MQTLQNHFLLAMPSLTDVYFERSLVYLCEHSSEGAMGLVVNIPVDMSLDAMLTKLKDLGGIPTPGTAADFGKFLTAETSKWEKVVHAAKLSIQ